MPVISLLIFVFMSTDLADACNIYVYADACPFAEVERFRNFLSDMVPSYEPVAGKQEAALWTVFGRGQYEEVKKLAKLCFIRSLLAVV